METLRFEIHPDISSETLNELFHVSWADAVPRDFKSILDRSLLHVSAFDADRCVGFVNVAWDGGVHAFLLDTTVHPEYRRRGIGSALVQRAIIAAREHPIEWIHVDCETELWEFYRKCGFRHTAAGLIDARNVVDHFTSSSSPH